MEKDDLVKSFVVGDVRALAKLITKVEEQPELAFSFFSQIHKLKGPNKGRSFLVGITGPPGAGKSTLIDCLISNYRKDGISIGVVAVDPTSPFTGGAFLGDRVRMQRHSGDEGVYIRSLGSRGSVGGISRATRDAVRLLELFGKEIIFIETVGVGQIEIDVMKISDITVVILVPESGDMIQTMKAGLMEIADVLVVNKSDREGADVLLRELNGMKKRIQDPSGQSMISEKPILVFSIEAIKGKGVEELYKSLKVCKEEIMKNLPDIKYLESEFLDLLSTAILDRLPGQFRSDSELSSILGDVGRGKINPYDAVFKVLGDQELKARLLKSEL